MRKRYHDKRLGHPSNIIFIQCDQWRPDCLGCLDHPIVQTPNLDALAEGGILFEKAYCASPVCSPAKSSMITGLYPHAHGQLINAGGKPYPGNHLRSDCVTLGDTFKGAGYHCGFVGSWHMGDDGTPQHGFEEFWKPSSHKDPIEKDGLAEYFKDIGVANLYDKKGRVKRFHGNFDKMRYKILDDPRQQRTTWTIDRGLDFLKERATSKAPRFLFLSIKDPHPTIVVPPDLAKLYPPEEIPLPPNWDDPLEGKPVYQRQSPGWMGRPGPVEEYRRMVAHYYALITHIDREIGRLMQALTDAGVRDNTLIVFVSDHGEMLGEHGLVTKRSFYEPSVRVPCILSWPDGLPSRVRIRTPISGVDLAPTLLSLAGVSLPGRIDGRNLSPDLLEGREPEAQPVFAELATQEVHEKLTDDLAGLGGHIMVRDGDWKYVWNQFDLNELYNLKEDSSEMKNLAGEPAFHEVEQESRKCIRKMLKKTGPGVYAWCFREIAENEKNRKNRKRRPIMVAGIMGVPVREGDYKEQNYREAEALIREAARAGAQLVCTIEQFLDGYGFDANKITDMNDSRVDRYEELGESKYLKRLGDLARELKLFIVAGVGLKEEGQTYNSALIFDPSGEIAGKYRKTFNHGQYATWFAPLSEAEKKANCPSFDLGTGRISVKICNDRGKRETTVYMVENGCELLLCPSYGGYKPNGLIPDSKEFGIWTVFVHPLGCQFIDDGAVVFEKKAKKGKGSFALHEVEFRKPEIEEQL